MGKRYDLVATEAFTKGMRGADAIGKLTEYAKMADAATAHTKMLHGITGETEAVAAHSKMLREMFSGAEAATAHTKMLREMFGETERDTPTKILHKLFSETDAATAHTKMLREMFGETGRLKGALDIHRELHDRTGFASIAHARAFAEPESYVGKAFGPLAALHDRLSTTYGTQFASKWDRGLPGALVPGVAALALGCGEQPSAILGSFSKASTSGAMLWVGDTEDEAHVSVAATHPRVKPVQPPSTEPLRLSIEAAVSCMLCDAKMLASGTELAWTSNDKVLIKLAVFPLCATCTRRAREDPGYWMEQLEELSQPRLELISGEGSGDGIPRGTLRLIERED